MKITFYGATTSVTGSCHLITTENHKVLLDCGQYQGGKKLEEQNFEEFPFDPAEIDCLILSHAHIDHCGRIPLLVKRGFKGKIFCTDATADLVDVMLKDSAHIHEKETEWKNIKAQRAGKPLVEPLYTTPDALASLQYLTPIMYDQLIEVCPNIKIVFNDAGHILGSAITEIWVTENEKTEKIIFTGDIGVFDRPILRNPTYIKKADYVIMEATYGSRKRNDKNNSVKELIDIIIETKNRGGTVVIPSFAVGRTQELIYDLNRYYDDMPEYKGELDNLMVYIDSPMATTVTEVFRKNAQVFDEETKDYILKGDSPLDFKNLTFTRTTDESRQLNMNREPKVIISASGMCEAGRIRHHLKHNLWDSRNSIVFVGYQAEGTLGKMIVDGIPEVTLFGEEIKINAKIHNLEGFSGHADQTGLLDWISHMEVAPKEVFMVHGEESSKEIFAKLVEEKLGFLTRAIHGQTEVVLEGGKEISFESVEREAIDAERIEALKEKLRNLKEGLDGVLYEADLALGSSTDDSVLMEINSRMLEVEKSILNMKAKLGEEIR